MVIVVDILLTSCGAKPAIIQMQVSPTPEVEASITSEPQEVVEKANSPTKIFVHVCGAVNQSGVYELIEGSRVFEAIELAAGFTDEAHSQSINLADTVTDGQQIVVPTKEEAAQAPKQTVEAHAEQELININTADITRLQQLSGIGESKAKEILSHREKNGSFGSIEDIKNVSGIGEKLYERIKENITVD